MINLFTKFVTPLHPHVEIAEVDLFVILTHIFETYRTLQNFLQFHTNGIHTLTLSTLHINVFLKKLILLGTPPSFTKHSSISTSHHVFLRLLHSTTSRKKLHKQYPSVLTYLLLHSKFFLLCSTTLMTFFNILLLSSLITIRYGQEWNLSSSVKCIFRKTRANRILVKQCIVFIPDLMLNVIINCGL